MGAPVTSTVIANLALSHLQHGKAIGNLDSENSEAANACRLFFESCRKEVLRDFQWPDATAFLTLALVTTQPTTEWGYSYRYPADCLFFRRILSGIRSDSRQSRTRYRIARDSSGRLIYTDMPNAVAEYTVDLTDVSQFQPDLQMAFSLLLASYVAPRVTAGDPFKLGAAALDRYRIQISKAKGNAANEEQPDGEPESEFIRARGRGMHDESEFTRCR